LDLGKIKTMHLQKYLSPYDYVFFSYWVQSSSFKMTISRLELKERFWMTVDLVQLRLDGCVLNDIWAKWVFNKTFKNL